MSKDFSTTFGDQILIEGAATVIGTAMLGTAFGTIKSFSVKRTASAELLLNGAGNPRSKVFTALGYEGTLEAAFDLSVAAPAIGERITLPLVGVVARVQEGVEVKWEQGKERGLSIPVSAWDSMVNQGFYSVDPVTQERILLDLPPPALQAQDGETTIVLAWPVINGATSYTLQVSEDNGTTWTLLTSTNLLTYTHNGLDPGNTRHYRIRAVNALGAGPWSQTVVGNITGV